jgi:hypothetical protein
MTTNELGKEGVPATVITVTCPQTNNAIAQSLKIKGSYATQLMGDGYDVICTVSIPGVSPNTTQTVSNAPSPWSVSFSGLPLHAASDVTLTANLVSHGTTSPILASKSITGLSITSNGVNCGP